jgi:hypothetical protein
MHWQFSANKKDIPKLIEVAYNIGKMFLPKGNANMVTYPQVNDKVSVTADSKVRVKGTVIDVIGRHLFLIQVDQVFIDNGDRLPGKRRNWTIIE